MLLTFTLSVANASQAQLERAKEACLFGVSNVWEINSIKKRLGNKEFSLHTKECYQLSKHTFDGYKSDPEMFGCSFGVSYTLGLLSPKDAEELSNDDNETLNLISYYCKKYIK